MVQLIIILIGTLHCSSERTNDSLPALRKVLDGGLMDQQPPSSSGLNPYNLWLLGFLNDRFYNNNRWIISYNSLYYLVEYIVNMQQFSKPFLNRWGNILKIISSLTQPKKLCLVATTHKVVKRCQTKHNLQLFFRCVGLD
jgi:hypothetical protein